MIEYVEFSPNDFLVKAGEFSSEFFIIKSGIVRSYFLTQEGKEITRAFFTPGYITGASSAIMKGIPSELNYQSLTPVTAYKGNLIKLKELTLEHHELAMFYIKTLEDAYLKAEAIVLEIASSNAEERYINLKERIPNIDNIIAQKYIASYLNVTTVQLSRIRKKMYSR
ncbi:Crp/Fnr family transcriptional regulator [Tenacibaculum sp. 190130A14a]|uniref:Crp/Fnr family transcriptional regulator n=1 Tax=Tenacibaculum polynesiense TaxID=3137857 RepID=UPI0032B2EA28